MGRLPKNIEAAKRQQRLTQLTQNQSINISKALVNSLGEGDRININYQPIMIVHEQSPPLPSNDEITDLQELVWVILEKLPHPKMDNLKKLALKAALTKIKRGADVAMYFDLQRTYVSKLKRDLETDPLFCSALAALPGPK